MPISNRCISGVMTNLTKKSWTVSTYCPNIYTVNVGLLGVQAMAFPHGENQIEVACNVDLVLYDEKNPKHKVHNKIYVFTSLSTLKNPILRTGLIDATAQTFHFINCKIPAKFPYFTKQISKKKSK